MKEILFVIHQDLLIELRCIFKGVNEMKNFVLVTCVQCHTSEMRLTKDKTKGCKSCGNKYVIVEKKKAKPLNEIPKSISFLCGFVKLTYNYSKKEYKSFITHINGHSYIIFSGLRYNGQYDNNEALIELSIECNKIKEW